MKKNSIKDAYYGVGSRPEVAALIPALPDNARILEVGCGEGGFRKNFNNSIEYWGVEPFINAAEVAEKSIDYVLHGTFDEVVNSIPLEYFDLIVCNDVIEHMIDPQTFLSKIKLKMKKNGILIGSIPNVRFADNLYRLLFLMDWQYSNEGILDRTHLRFFTKKSIVRILTESNFIIMEIRGIGAVQISFKSFRLSFYTIGLKLIGFIFGADAKYLQFAFRVKLNS